MNAFTLLFVSLDQLYMWIFTERMLPALLLPLVLHFIPILERLMQDCRLIFQHLERRTRGKDSLEELFFGLDLNRLR